MKPSNAITTILVLICAAAAMALVPPQQSAARTSAVARAEQPMPVADDYYVTGRYYCVADDDGSDRASCDITTHAASCQAAYQAQQADVAARGDVCRKCSEGTDNTKHYSGKMEWIQLGPCRAGN